MNIQAETNQDKDKGLVYEHDEARVLATVITTFNEHMECTVEEQGQQYVVPYSLKAGINKFGEQGKASAHKEMKQLHDRSCFRPVHKCLLNKSERRRVMAVFNRKEGQDNEILTLYKWKCTTCIYGV